LQQLKDIFDENNIMIEELNETGRYVQDLNIKDLISNLNIENQNNNNFFSSICNLYHSSSQSGTKNQELFVEIFEEYHRVIQRENESLYKVLELIENPNVITFVEDDSVEMVFLVEESAQNSYSFTTNALNVSLAIGSNMTTFFNVKKMVIGTFNGIYNAKDYLTGYSSQEQAANGLLSGLLNFYSREGYRYARQEVAKALIGEIFALFSSEQETVFYTITNPQGSNFQNIMNVPSTFQNNINSLSGRISNGNELIIYGATSGLQVIKESAFDAGSYTIEKIKKADEVLKQNCSIQ